jgi:HlyD family secretion protein
MRRHNRRVTFPRQRPIRRLAPGRRLVAPLIVLAILGCSHRPGPVVGSGTIELDEVDVSSLVGGRVLHLYVDEGDTVSAGDTLAVLLHGEVTGEVTAMEGESDRANALYREQARGPRDAEIKAARAELAAATTTLQLDEAELKRVQGLYEQKFASPSELDHARAARDEAAARRSTAEERLALLEEGYRREQVAAAKGAARAAQGQLTSAKAKAKELVLTAPISGVVLIRSVVAGEVVGPAIPLVTLGNLDRIWLRAYLSTPEVARIRLGARAKVRVLGWPGRDFPGRVTEISPRAEFTPRAALTEEERASLVFGVKIALDPTGGILKPGLPADATIETAAPPAPQSAAR